MALITTRSENIAPLALTKKLHNWNRGWTQINADVAFYIIRVHLRESFDLAFD
jgi:ribosome modulation factor